MTPDRATRGLRGPIKSFVERSTFLQLNDPEKKALEVHWESGMEYDFDGRLTLTRHRNNDGSYWITRYDYSPSGHLLKTASGTEGQAPTETHYHYDEQGRLQKVTGASQPPLAFHYDEHGRKTMVAVSRPEDYRPNTATAGSPFEAAAFGPNLPGGGSATTLYDEHDRPTELQVRDSRGELVSHAVRTYDAKGHVIEEKQMEDSMVSMFPPEAMAKIQADSGMSPDQLREQLGAQIKQFLGGERETYLVRYRYDSSGHLTHTSRRIFNHHGDEIETSYNEPGDVASEITRSTRSSGAGESHVAVNSYSEVQHAYEYDERGNWTLMTLSHRSSTDAAFQLATVIKRSLTYY